MGRDTARHLSEFDKRDYGVGMDQPHLREKKPPMSKFGCDQCNVEWGHLHKDWCPTQKPGYTSTVEKRDTFNQDPITKLWKGPDGRDYLKVSEWGEIAKFEPVRRPKDPNDVWYAKQPARSPTEIMADLAVKELETKEGRKYDAGKAPIFQGVITYFPRALAAVAQVSAYGLAKYKLKYEDKNWAKVDNGFGRYSDGLARHLASEAIERDDPESHLMHAAHAAWNALARLEYLLQTGASDNNPDKEGPTNEESIAGVKRSG